MIDFTKTTLELLQLGEGLTIEFKRTVDSPYKIAKTITSFANTSGGILLIGISDNREATGIVSELRELSKLERASSLLVEPELLIRCKIVTFGQKKILRVEVGESEQKPHFAINEKGQKIIYIRTKDKSVPTNRLMLPGEGDPITDKLLTSRPVKKIIQYLKQNDTLTDKELSQLINVSDKRAAKMLVELENVGILLARRNGKSALYSLKLVQ